MSTHAATAPTSSTSERSHLGATLFLGCLAQFMVILDVSVVNVALPAIRHGLGFSEVDLQWVVNAYTVTFAVHAPGRVLLPPQTIALSKDYSFDEHFQLAKEHEADILKEQMARDLVAIAMHRLTSLK